VQKILQNFYLNFWSATEEIGNNSNVHIVLVFKPKDVG